MASGNLLDTLSSTTFNDIPSTLIYKIVAGSENPLTRFVSKDMSLAWKEHVEELAAKLDVEVGGERGIRKILREGVWPKHVGNGLVTRPFFPEILAIILTRVPCEERLDIAGAIMICTNRLDIASIARVGTRAMLSTTPPFLSQPWYESDAASYQTLWDIMDAIDDTLYDAVNDDSLHVIETVLAEAASFHARFNKECAEDEYTGWGAKPLLLAMSKRNAKIVRMLFDAGAAFNIGSPHTRRVVRLSYDDEEMRAVLMHAHGGKWRSFVQFQMLLRGIFCKNHKAVQDIVATLSRSWVERKGSRILIFAMRSLNSHLMRILMDAGCVMDKKDDDDHVPIENNCCCGCCSSKDDIDMDIEYEQYSGLSGSVKYNDYSDKNDYEEFADNPVYESDPDPAMQ